jgi:hypothetical protein
MCNSVSRLLGAFVFAGVAAPIAMAAIERVSNEDVLKALSRREFGIESARVEFFESVQAHSSESSKKGPRLSPQELELQNEIKRAMAEYLLPSKFTLVVKKDRIRVEQTRPSTAAQPEIQTGFKRTAVFNGEISKVLIDDKGTHRGGNKYCLGTVSHKDNTDAVELVAIDPLAIALRPLKWLHVHGFEPSRSTIHKANDADDGKPVTVIKFQNASSPGISYEIFLTMEKNALPIRMTTYNGGSVRLQVDVTKTSTVNDIDLPRSWTISRYGENGKPVDTKTSNVMSASVNSGVSDELFDLVFPVGTLVTDTRGSHTARYIQKENNLVRDISEAEWNDGVPYEQLLSNDRIGSRSINTRAYCLTGTILCIVILLMALVRKRWPRSGT